MSGLLKKERLLECDRLSIYPVRIRLEGTTYFLELD
jgi:hypothetical protein